MTYSLLTAITAVVLSLPSISFGADLVGKAGKAKVSREEVHFLINALPEGVRSQVTSSQENIELFLIDVLQKKSLGIEADKLAEKEGGDKAIQLEYELLETKTQFLIEQYKASLAIPDMSELARQEYEARKEQIARVPEAREVSHILLQCESAECDQNALKAEMEVVRNRIVAGESFEELAMALSKDPGSAKKGGKLSFAFTADDPKVDFSFRNATFEIQKEGDLSPVMESQFGVHIIRLDKKTPAFYRPFSELRPKIMEILGQQWVREKVQAYRRQALASDDLTFDPVLLKEFVAQPAQQKSIDDKTGE